MQMPNAQGIAGLMSQGRAPQQPQQPQQPMPSPMKASPMAAVGSVEDRVAAYRGNPAPLQQRYAMSQDLLDLLALQKIKSEKESAARQMQMQIAQQRAAEGADMTIAQQREKEVMDLTKNELAQQRGQTAQQQVSEQQSNLQKLLSGIAGAPGAQTVAQPKMMAAGGIVAFQEGGNRGLETGPALDAARARRNAAREAVYRYGLRQQQQDPEGFVAAQQELRDAEAALAAAQRGYEGAMGEAGISTPIASPKDIGAASRFQAAEERATTPPPVSDVYPDEARRGSRAGLAGIPRPSAPPAPRVAPTATPAPIASAAPAATPAPAAAPAGISGLRESIEKGLQISSADADTAKREEILNMFKLTPEQRGVYEQGIAQRQKMYQEAYDPERQRQEGLKRFLIGAGGRRFGELGAGATTAMGYDESQRAQRQRDFEALQRTREGLIGLEREGIKPAIEGGLKARDTASAERRQAMASGVNVTDIEAREYSAARAREIELKKANLQAELNRINREGVELSRAQAVFSNTMSKARDLLKDMDEQFVKRPDISILLMQDPKTLTSEQRNRLEVAQTEHELAKRKIKREVEAELAPVRTRLGMGASTEGWGALGTGK